MRHVPSRRHEDPRAGLSFFEESRLSMKQHALTKMQDLIWI